jgi:hypothetical protein
MAGKGFAVVAGEVKTLAQQSGRATDEIASKIAAVRETCSAVVSTISQIIQAIKNLKVFATEISTGIGQQSAATAGIFASAQCAADSSRAVAANIVDQTVMPMRRLRPLTKCLRPPSACSTIPAACRPMSTSSLATLGAREKRVRAA